MYLGITGSLPGGLSSHPFALSADECGSHGGLPGLLPGPGDAGTEIRKLIQAFGTKQIDPQGMVSGSCCLPPPPLCMPTEKQAAVGVKGECFLFSLLQSEIIKITSSPHQGSKLPSGREGWGWHSACTASAHSGTEQELDR